LKQMKDNFVANGARPGVSSARLVTRVAAVTQAW